MKRQHVHLSSNLEEAFRVAKRKSDETEVLRINAIKAFDAGISFYSEGNGVWLSDYIPSKFF